MRLLWIVWGALLALMLPATARADELFGGLYAHDVKTPLDKSGIESGADLSEAPRYSFDLQPGAFE